MQTDVNRPAIVRPSANAKVEVRKAFERFEAAGTKRLEEALLIGQMLVEQKKKTPHGQWLKWIEDNLPFDRYRAAEFMRVSAERGKCADACTFEEALEMLRCPESPERDELMDRLMAQAKELLAEIEADFRARLELAREVGERLIAKEAACREAELDFEKAVLRALRIDAEKARGYMRVAREWDDLHAAHSRAEDILIAVGLLPPYPDEPEFDGEVWQ